MASWHTDETARCQLSTPPRVPAAQWHWEMQIEAAGEEGKNCDISPWLTSDDFLSKVWLLVAEKEVKVAIAQFFFLTWTCIVLLVRTRCRCRYCRKPFSEWAESMEILRANWPSWVVRRVRAKLRWSRASNYEFLSLKRPHDGERTDVTIEVQVNEGFRASQLLVILFIDTILLTMIGTLSLFCILSKISLQINALIHGLFVLYQTQVLYRRKSLHFPHFSLRHATLCTWT